MNERVYQETLRIDEDVALLALDLFAGVAVQFKSRRSGQNSDRKRNRSDRLMTQTAQASDALRTVLWRRRSTCLINSPI
jgi:hypothetical protein